MNIKINQLIFKYELLKKDCIDKERYYEAKIASGVVLDLTKLKEIINKQNKEIPCHQQ